MRAELNVCSILVSQEGGVGSIEPEDVRNPHSVKLDFAAFFSTVSQFAGEGVFTVCHCRSVCLPRWPGVAVQWYIL